MFRKVLSALLLLSLFIPLSAAQYTVESTELVVYPDGYVRVVQVVRPDDYTVAVTLPLLNESPEGIMVVDEDGSPLPYEIVNSTLAVYFENASLVKVTYYTSALTSKEGSVWRIKLSSDTPVTFHLPDNAVVVKLSTVPLMVEKNHIVMPAGNVSISYVIEKFAGEDPAYAGDLPGDGGDVGGEAGSPGTSASGGSGTGWPLYLLPALGLAFAGAGYSVMAKRKRKSGEKDAPLPMTREEYRRKLEEGDLTGDEIRVLLYIYDRGGRTTQAEVKKMLNIPKTTAWRMFKRLEERGLIRVYKKRRENWVELLF